MTKSLFLILSIFFFSLKGPSAFAQTPRFEPIIPGRSFTYNECRDWAKDENKRRLSQWQNPESSIPKNSVLIVLGGGYSRDCEAVEFYKRFKPRNIIVSGWPDDPTTTIPDGVERIVRVLINGGVPPQIIIRDEDSQNTRAHPYFTNRIIHERFKLRPPVVLLSDKWHLLRAESYFKAYGFPPDYIWGSNPSISHQGLTEAQFCKQVNPEDPFDFVNGEADAFAGAGLCDGLAPKYRDDYDIDSINIDLTMPTDRFEVTCRQFLRHANNYSPEYHFDLEYCREVTNSVGYPATNYDQSIECITRGFLRGWDDSLVHYNCLDDVMSDIFKIPKQYVHTLISRPQSIRHFIDMTAVGRKRLDNHLKKGPGVHYPNGIDGFVHNNEHLGEYIEKSIGQSSNGARIVITNISGN